MIGYLASNIICQHRGDQKMKKRVLIGLVLITLALLLSGIPAQADSPRGITGSVRFSDPEWGVDKGWLRINIHEVNPEKDEARGQAHWLEYNSDEGWRHVFSQVTCIAFGDDVGQDAQSATFVVQITRKIGWGALEPGQYVKFWVRDGGTPGREGDEWTTLFWPENDDDDTVPACGYETAPAEYRVPVNGGNLVIHH
jgi:hypothetical protein